MAAAGVGAATARPPPEAPSSYPARGDPSPAPQLLTGRDVRHAARSKTWTAPTAGLAPGFLQANLIVLPARYAADFRLLCARNPVPCPLVAESAGPGVYDAVRSHVRTLSAARLLSNDCDLRADAPRYMVYRDAALVRAGCTDVQDEWRDDHIAFLIGCSYSFEGALAAAGLPARHAVQARNVPMYRTSVPLCPAGVFVNSTYVVSMRPYKAAELDRVRDITRGYNDTHGEPIAWGWDALDSLGIRDIDRPDWGDAPLSAEGRPFGVLAGSQDEIPVFWGCGVTPQEAVMRANIQGTVLGHAPGHMILLDCQDQDILKL